MTATATTLEQRYQEVQDRIAAAAVRAGRDEGVILVAVTKHAEPDQIRTLINLGHRDFGENRIQHLIQRAAMCEEYLARHRVLGRTPKPRSGLFDSGSPTQAQPPDAVRWHMIGHLQRNKARKAAETCRLIHSVDSLRLAEELQTIGLKRDRATEVLLQVNCSGEPQKFGCPPPAARHLAEQIETMLFVRLRGVMTMAAYSDDPEASRPAFARCREIFEDIRATGVGEGRFNILSMGMSHDCEVAISEGANIVRIGAAIFGEPRTE
jgi:PLP dependent protein